VALQAGEAGAQARSPADGFTPLAMTPGAPSGSFALSGFENVNLFNGNLSRAEGGALVLNEAEHMLTRTFAGRGRVVAGQEAGMAFRDVLARDIRTFEV